jgi:hypothetical protein
MLIAYCEYQRALRSGLAGCSLEFELSLCVGEGSPASGAIPSRIESLGVRQRRLECRFGTFLGPLHRPGCRLVLELRGN